MVLTIQFLFRNCDCIIVSTICNSLIYVFISTTQFEEILENLEGPDPGSGLESDPGPDLESDPGPGLELGPGPGRGRGRGVRYLRRRLTCVAIGSCR